MLCRRLLLLSFATLASATTFADIFTHNDAVMNNPSAGATPVLSNTSEARAIASLSYQRIASRGLRNACYLDADHYVAEFLYQNPNACFWQVNTRTRQVTELPVPVAPRDAIRLPRPTGRNDTARLEAFINARRGKTLVGTGVYRVNDMKIRVPVTIFNMPMKPYGNASLMVSVRAPDVRIYNSPIDARGSRNTNLGFDVRDDSDRFILVNSGFSNSNSSNNRNSAGVLIRSVDDFHIACNRFDNILNVATQPRTTARANAIWMNGGGYGSSSGGVIANNRASNLQSKGFLQDAEFFTMQGYRTKSSDKPVRIFANRGVDAGKRLTKHQSSGALVLSNSFNWATKNGPLGDRRMFAVVNVQKAHNVTARNNRISVGGDSRFDHIFHTNAVSSGFIQRDLHFDCNSIQVRDKLGTGNRASPAIISARAATPSANGRYAAINSTAIRNFVYGAGNVMNYYNFGMGYQKYGGRFNTRGNLFRIPYTSSQHR